MEAQTTEENSPQLKGVAPIKKEYLVLVKGQVINWDHLPEDELKRESGRGGTEENPDMGEKRERVDDRDLYPSKKFKLKGQNKNKLRYKIGKKVSWSRGRKIDDDGNGNNDNDQPRERIDKASRLCLKFMDKEGVCPHEEKCDYCHDLYKIYKAHEDDLFKPDMPCYIYTNYGRCQYGVACLYSKTHTKLLEEQKKVYNLIDHRKWSLEGGREDFFEKIRNKLETTTQHKLRKKAYDFKLVSQAMNVLYKADVETNNNEESEQVNEANVARIGAAIVDDFVKGRDFSRKKVDFKNKLYLAPLTTVGNLPFRRLCKKFSCDITCAEMSLCSSLLNGNPSEWSHLKRHESEDVFGVQITASHPEHTTKIVKVLNDQCELDFVDLNCGCPTEWIYQSGAGAGLMSRPSKLRKMIAGASMVSKVPVTVKMRAGCSEDKNTAHNIINSVIKPFTSKYVGAVTIHGRSRAQRYTKLADWHYVNECGRFTDDIPLIGSGDCISWQEYYENLEKYKNISSVMLARGALISPWLFTEIKERRTWDITGKERLEIIGDYVKFALDHWGSDATGVENSRRYLLEWLSFACRYIPVGLLEVLPQKINERPPMYKGRDELETLLSSPSASDWVKISEMFLGKVPDDFRFLPKHKANAYESIVEG